MLATVPFLFALSAGAQSPSGAQSRGSAPSYFSSCYTGQGNIFTATLLIPEASLSQIFGHPLTPGSELAVFPAAGNDHETCIGTTVWTGSTTYITLWADDYLTPLDEGLEPGDAFQLKVYDALSGSELPPEMLSFAYLNGPPAFELDGVFILESASTLHVAGGPVAENDLVTVVEDHVVEIDVLANDYPGDLGVVTIVGVSATSGTAELVAESGTILFTPAPDFFGTASLTYVVRDDAGRMDGGTVTVTVIIQNDLPRFDISPEQSAEEGTWFHADLTAIDVDGDDVQVTAVQIPDWTRFYETGSGTAVIEGVPSSTDTGESQIILAASDGTASIEYTVHLTVSAATRPPLRPAPLIPAHQATDIPLRHRFEWDRTPGAVNSRIQIALSTDYAFTNPVLDQTTREIWFDVTELGPASAYMWRVRGENSAGQGSWSPIRLFSTQSVQVTGVENVDGIPTSLRLDQNYPNPFNPETVIEFGIPVTAHARLEIYDMLGRRRAVLEDGILPAGMHRVSWNASNESSGLYVYRLVSEGNSLTRTLSLLK